MTTTEAHEKVLVWDRYTGVAVLTMQQIYIYVDFTLFNYLSANTFVCGLNILSLHVSNFNATFSSKLISSTFE
jgi:hypothetical protein